MFGRFVFAYKDCSVSSLVHVHVVNTAYKEFNVIAALAVTAPRLGEPADHLSVHSYHGHHIRIRLYLGKLDVALLELRCMHVE